MAGLIFIRVKHCGLEKVSRGFAFFLIINVIHLNRDKIDLNIRAGSSDFDKFEKIVNDIFYIAGTITL